MATEIIDNDARSGYARVIINVENENDNDPVFDQDVYTQVIQENSNITFVTSVSH